MLHCRTLLLRQKTTLLLTPDNSFPTQNFANIKQGVKESFIEFVDRLKLTLEKQIKSAEGRKEVLKIIAMVNTNPECREILKPISLDSEPTIEQMVEACTRHTSTEKTVAQAVAKDIADGVAGAIAVVAAKDNQGCFCCKELGHFLKDCPDRDSITDFRYRNPWHQQWSSYQMCPGSSQQTVEWPHVTISNLKLSHSALPTILEQSENWPPASSASEILTQTPQTSHTGQFRLGPNAS